MLQYPLHPESYLARALAEHAAFIYPEPSLADLRRLAWSVVHMPDPTVLELALAESLIQAVDQLEREEARRAKAASPTQRELGA